MKVAVLGAGMVGRTIALDLIKYFEVTSFDRNITMLQILQKQNTQIKTQEADLSDTSSYKMLFSSFEYIVSAVPGFMGFKTLEALVKLGKKVADISFFPEDALTLDELAKANNATAIVDCGVAPGMSNLILGFYNREMHITHFNCMVGGLPVQREFPWEYKAPFSPVDVIEEYMRPARYKENGHIVVREALSDPELVNIPPVGTLESFNTDGLRSLLFTLPHIPNMKEKTLRYPGHIRFIKALKQSGFFDEKPIKYKNQEIIPLQFTSALLFNQWELKQGEKEFTIMKIDISGENKEGKIDISYLLYDEGDVDTQNSSMSRTTGFTCAAMLNLMHQKMFLKKGIFPPELVGSEPGCYQFVMDYLKKRGVHYNITVLQS